MDVNVDIYPVKARRNSFPAVVLTSGGRRTRSMPSRSAPRWQKTARLTTGLSTRRALWLLALNLRLTRRAGEKQEDAA